MSNVQKYGGTWQLFKKEELYSGELHIDFDNRVIALELLIPANEESPMPRPPYKGKIPYIHGTLFSGANLLLYDCSTGKEHTHVMQYTQQIIYAKYAFWELNISNEEDLKFTGAIFDFGDIIEWSNLCSYSWDFAENGGSNLRWTRKSPIEFELHKNLKVTFSATQGTIGGDGFAKEITAKQHVFVEFAYMNSVAWDSIMDDVLCIAYFIGLGMNQKVEVEVAKYCHASIYYEIPKDEKETRKISRPADVILGTGHSRKTLNTKRYDCLYTLDKIHETDGVTKWRKNYSQLKPILDLYFTAFSNTAATPEMLFLNLTQALETFHARFITDDAQKYKNRVDDLVTAFCNDGTNAEQWGNFLIDEGQKKNTQHIYLRSRLADLIFAEGELPFWPNGYNISKYIGKLVDTRNYYTHYNPSKMDKSFTKTELPLINGHLISLIEYHLLILMGFDKAEVRRKTVEEISRIDVAYNVQESTHETKK